MDPMLTDDSLAPTAFGEPEPQPELLSYDDSVAYEDQVGSTSLADRIGRGKIYLLEDAAPTANLKRKKDGEDEEIMMDEDGLDEDPQIRSNALFFTGPPIAHLPTTRIFAYATHFEAKPLGLEWVSDTTCVLVFSSKSEARKAYNALQKLPDEEPSLDDGSITAKSIPVTLWPAEERISRTLGLALATEDRQRENERRKEGLAAPLRMRWARIDDVKKKGARNQSEFYRKHGRLAGKELVNGRDMPSLPGERKRRREDEDEDEEAIRARLDRELDAFIAEDPDDESKPQGRSLADRVTEPEPEADEPPASPPSKMRSDYIGDDGRTIIRKRNAGRQEGRQQPRQRNRREGRWKHNGEEGADGGLSLSDRIQGTARSELSLEWGPERKRRRGEGSGGDEREQRRHAGGRRVGKEADGERRSGGNSRTARPKKTQQELDDELDAFLAQA